MISPKLRHTFHLLETLVFPIWQAADAADRERITRELGKYEAEEILKEIESECGKLSG